MAKTAINKTTAKTSAPVESQSVADLESKLAAALKLNEDLKAQNTELRRQVKLAQEDLITLNSSLVVQEKSVSSPSVPVVTVDGLLYRFQLQKFIFDGALYTAASASDNDALLKKLTAKRDNGKLKYGVLKLIS